MIGRRGFIFGGLTVGAAALQACAGKPAKTGAPLAASSASRAHTTRVIDVHAHWYPPEFVAIIEREGPSAGAKVSKNEQGWTTFAIGGISTFFSPVQMDISQRLDKMDALGVDVHVLSLTQPMVYWAPPALGLKLSQAFNDACAAAHDAHPTRFFGLAMVPMQSPQLALGELQRVSTMPGMRGLYLCTQVNGANLDESAYWPIFGKCEELGWPVFLHPVDPVGADRMRTHYLRNLLGNPYETGIAAASLVFGGVMDSFPKLEVTLPHGGGAFPGLIGRLDHGVEVRPELKNMKQPASAYLRRFHYDTIVHNGAVLSNLVRQVGADRVMMGSDYPFDMGYEHPVQVVERLSELSLQDRALILGANASGLLKI